MLINANEDIEVLKAKDSPISRKLLAYWSNYTQIADDFPHPIKKRVKQILK
jgi:predicted metal-dependent hydrolase